MTEQEIKDQKMIIGKNNLITVGSAGALFVLVLSITITAYDMRHGDIERARLAREEDKRLVLAAQAELQAALLLAISDLKAELRANDQSTLSSLSSMHARINELERQSGHRWTGPMMEVWVLQSQQAAELIDPAPIIERYSNER